MRDTLHVQLPYEAQNAFVCAAAYAVGCLQFLSETANGENQRAHLAKAAADLKTALDAAMAAETFVREVECA